VTTAQPLGEIADIVRGISFPKDAKSLVPREGDVACLRTTNVQRDVEWNDLWFVPSEHVKRAEQFVQPGDILISTANSYELVGKVALVSSMPRESTLGAFISLIRPRPGVEPKYLYHQLAWGRTQSRIRETASTTTNISNVSTKKLAALELDLPRLDEQRRIVAELEKQLSRLDEAVANLKRVKANLKRYKSAVLSAAVEGRPAAAPDVVQAHAAAARDASAASALPPGWRWSTVGELAKVGTGATPSRSKAAYWNGGDIPWVTSAAVNEPYVNAAAEFVTQAALAETNLTLYPPGTLLVAMYGEGKTRGKCTELRIPATTNQALAALQVAEGLRPYLKLFLDHSYEDMRKVASGGVQPNLNLGLVRALRVPLPPPSEQSRIIAEVERRLSIAREVEAEVDANLKRAQLLQQAVLARQFAGRD
jgi:type I restriction enzyme S subunit